MKTAIGAYATSPTMSVLSECNIVPLKFRREKLSVNYTARILNLTSNQTFPLINAIQHVNTKKKKKITPTASPPFYFSVYKYL